MTEATTRPLRVLMLAAECKPYAWTGGLGDVVGSLPTALRNLGADVRVALPHYGAIDSTAHDVTTNGAAFTVPMDGVARHGSIGLVEQSPFPLYLIGSEDYFANRPNLYGYPDDGHRFVFFSRGALEAARAMGWQPDIVHCHDWHSGLVPNWIRAARADAERRRTRRRPRSRSITWRTRDTSARTSYRRRGSRRVGFWITQPIPELTPRLIFLARGIRYADAINTVSATYAREILTPSYGERLDALLRERRDGILGIVNGIDTVTLDPASDPHLTANYTAQDAAARAQNKAALQREVGLPVKADAPLLGMVSRLADHKGLDLLAPLLPRLVERGAQLVVLGTGDPRHHELLTQAAQEHPRHIAVALRFDPPLAQRIYGGSDMFLMPSRHEPCGLGQLIAMRYGSVPIVRATGGLADTVLDCDARTQAGNGVRVQPLRPHRFLWGHCARAGNISLSGRLECAHAPRYVAGCVLGCRRPGISRPVHARVQPAADRSEPLGQRQTGLGFEWTGNHLAAGQPPGPGDRDHAGIVHAMPKRRHVDRNRGSLCERRAQPGIGSHAARERDRVPRVAAWPPARSW